MLFIAPYCKRPNSHFIQFFFAYAKMPGLLLAKWVCYCFCADVLRSWVLRMSLHRHGKNYLHDNNPMHWHQSHEMLYQRNKGMRIKGIAHAELPTHISDTRASMKKGGRIYTFGLANHKIARKFLIFSSFIYLLPLDELTIQNS